MNSVCLIGRLTDDPELKYTKDGTAIASFTIAVNNSEDYVYFIPVVQWGKGAEATAEYCAKGREIAVSGELRQDRWETEDGEKRSRVYVSAQRIDWLRIPANKEKEEEKPKSVKSKSDYNKRKRA